MANPGAECSHPSWATLRQPADLYVGVDEEPIESEAFYRWLADRSGLPMPPPDGSPTRSNKRCSSGRLRDSGYRFRFPTFREGFASLMGRRLAPCPESPNCVSSQAKDRRHRMGPIGFTCSAERAAAAVTDVIRRAGGRIVSSEDGYVRAEFTSRFFGFVDDVELLIDADSHRIDFRSASRVGYSDLGANRRRMRGIVKMLSKSADFAVLSDDP